MRRARTVREADAVTEEECEAMIRAAERNNESS